MQKAKWSPSWATWAPRGGGGNDLHFYSPQPNIRLHCEATNMWPVYCTVCLFTPELLLVPNNTSWWQRHTGVSSLSRPLCNGAAAGLKPVTYILIYHITPIRCIILWSTNKRNKKQTLEWQAQTNAYLMSCNHQRRQSWQSRLALPVNIKSTLRLQSSMEDAVEKWNILPRFMHTHLHISLLHVRTCDKQLCHITLPELWWKHMIMQDSRKMSTAKIMLNKFANSEKWFSAPPEMCLSLIVYCVFIICLTHWPLSSCLIILCSTGLHYTTFGIIMQYANSAHLTASDVTKLVKIRIHQIRISTFQIRPIRMRIKAFILSVGT